MEVELISCPGCGEEFSPYVNKCPHCGLHMHKRKHANVTSGGSMGMAIRMMVGGLALVLLGILFAWWSTL